MATNYTYDTVTSNGINLNYIKTSPNNVAPTYINPPKAMSHTGYYGINGGYFNNNFSILSIAVVNNLPVNGIAGDINGGWANQNYDRGTLVWDQTARQYSVQVVRRASELSVSDKNNYWAQGGISMCLDKNDQDWKAQMEAEHLSLTETDRRSALVYNSGLNIWLVTTSNRCTAGAFRSAISNGIGNNTLVNGIFLDGGSSASMRCKEFYMDANFLPEIIRLKNTD